MRSSEADVSFSPALQRIRRQIAACAAFFLSLTLFWQTVTLCTPFCVDEHTHTLAEPLPAVSVTQPTVLLSLWAATVSAERWPIVLVSVAAPVHSTCLRARLWLAAPVSA